MFDRDFLLKQLEQNTVWDVIIIGGGATGLGVAIDSATRGYKTLLLEQSDFAKGTSSRSTKLIHGGVRYLAQGNLDLVKEALYERGLLLKNASHLVRNQSFIIPTYSWWDTFFYTFGLKTYDFFSGKLSFGKSEWISKTKTASRLPTIKSEHLSGGVVYSDGQFDDARLAINMAQTAIEQGATVLNYVKVGGLQKDSQGQIKGVSAIDVETQHHYYLSTKVVINATGVFTDDILQMDDPEAKHTVRPSQGIHLVFDRSILSGNDAVMIPKTVDGRVLFLVPWHNRVVVGTTDTLVERHQLEPEPLENEVDFILNTLNTYLKVKVTKADVLSQFAGLRPLAAPKNASEKTKEISRSHKVIVSASDLITITGGKWTTYRRMAQDTINKAIALGKLPKKVCVTEKLSIHGADGSADDTDHLYIYGTDQKFIEALIEEAPELGEKLHPRLEFLKAEVVWAIKNEMARTIEDVLARRVRILFLDARAALEVAPIVTELFGKYLGKNAEWQHLQLQEFKKLAERYILK
ncbi:glycerol-3-phosphate dehydrogenase/oxidase [uncultured Gelidibacter sp.]|uniref:glycerol-3-phosphate dehydrogenase/oxidase n=1 Tax=uncultured Gelidibacter sp. TaxID=259318 RepID=UPI0026395B6D|nr:glycerol-3-phosphate dehydrogenase/oxidase [uncultured Gelidibacter sp.]